MYIATIAHEKKKFQDENELLANAFKDSGIKLKQKIDQLEATIAQLRSKKDAWDRDESRLVDKVEKLQVEKADFVATSDKKILRLRAALERSRKDIKFLSDEIKRIKVKVEVHQAQS